MRFVDQIFLKWEELDRKVVEVSVAFGAYHNYGIRTIRAAPSVVLAFPSDRFYVGLVVGCVHAIREPVWQSHGKLCIWGKRYLRARVFLRCMHFSPVDEIRPIFVRLHRSVGNRTAERRPSGSVRRNRPRQLPLGPVSLTLEILRLIHLTLFMKFDF